MLKAVSSTTNAIGALNYKGTWNASTNSPTLSSGVGTKGDYYVVSVAGSTSLDGVSNWGVGDLATYNGSVWQRVEGGADLNGVNLSATGTSTLNTLNVTGNTDLGNQQDSLTNGGRNTRVSSKSVTNNGTDWFGSYGECIWNANASATSGARRYSMINGGSYTNMAFMRSVDANTDPALAGNAGTASSGTVDFTWTSVGYFLIGYTVSNGAYPLQVNGQIFATSAIIATSDGRYKENVTPLTGSLDLIMALKPVQFDWKAHPVHKFDVSVPTVGFIAQDVQAALANQPYLNSIVKRNNCVLEPEIFDPKTGTVAKAAVTEEFLGISEGNLIALLTNAIQELKQEFDAYKATTKP